jgi:GxxExxY protein
MESAVIRVYPRHQRSKILVWRFIMLHEDITDKILKAFYKINNSLGYGFLEKVYENAMEIELQNIGCRVTKQKNIKVFYENKEVGDYYADLLVNDLVIVEIKASESLRKEHEAQLINYLKATDIEIGLLLNFGKKAEFKRKIFENERK